MSSNDVTACIQKAVNELELALDAYVKNEVEEAGLKVWNASAETEYALFILEVMSDSKLEIDIEDVSKKDELDPKEYVVKAQDHLRSALEDCQPGKNIDKVHGKIRAAREFLIRLQENLERPPRLKAK
jgi:hypothetical protein